MPDFHRHAVYYLPPEGGLARFGAAWLGWDALTGREAAPPDLPAPGLPAPDRARLTADPHKYGFHATIKPPFRLAAGQDAMALRFAFRDLCARMMPVTLAGLGLAEIGSFLALVPEGDAQGLRVLAGAAVRDLDSFRAPPSPEELARRRGKGLSASEDANLLRWGYPYVMDDFRFHMTLTGPVRDPAERAAVRALLTPMLAPLLPRPFVLDSLCLVGADAEGRFHLIERRRLSGRPD